MNYKKAPGVRDPSSHRTPEQIRAMDRGYNSRPSIIHRRSEQNKGRALLGLKKGDPRDAGHIRPLDKGGRTVRSNLEPQSRKKNRGWARSWNP
jgi:hypothetical protein